MGPLVPITGSLLSSWSGPERRGRESYPAGMSDLRTLDQLLAGLADVRASPSGSSTLLRIVRRPVPEQREAVSEATLDTEQGLVGDSWRTRGSMRMADGSADREAQITLMNSRFASLIAGPPAGWDAAGDQLYADLDLSEASLPAGSRLAIGEAVLVVSEVPHTGCAKFSARFGSDALRVANTPEGRALRLRGVNLRIERSGVVRVGDAIVRR